MCSSSFYHPACVASSASLSTQALALCLMAEALGYVADGTSARLPTESPHRLRSALVALALWVAPERCLAKRVRSLIADLDARYTDLAGLTFAALRMVSEETVQ